RICFAGYELRRGAMEHAAAVYKSGRIGGVLPEWFLRDGNRQRVEPGAAAGTGIVECGQVRPFDPVLAVTGGYAGRGGRDAEVGKNIAVVLKIHRERQSPLL